MNSTNSPEASESKWEGLLQRRIYHGSSGEALPYRLFVPRLYNSKRAYPLVLFLHGAGERGDDNRAQLKNDEFLCLVADEVQARNPCFVAAPQCPWEHQWVEVPWESDTPHQTPAEPSPPMRLTIELLDALLRPALLVNAGRPTGARTHGHSRPNCRTLAAPASIGTEFRIDPDRLYLTGLSMGGFGVFDLLIRRPNDFAAAVSICGGADDRRAAEIAHVALWIFHGSEDDAVPVVRSRSIAEALRKAGGSPRFTEYAHVGHHSWIQAFNEPELAPWLFGQRRLNSSENAPRPPASR